MTLIPNQGQATDRRTATAIMGAFSPAEQFAISEALDDLRGYWMRFFGAQSWGVAPADLTILAGSAENLPEIAALEGAGAIPPFQAPAESFALDVLEVDGRAVAVLRARDMLGWQYAVYAFAEAYLGVRFTHPFSDIIPAMPPCPEQLQICDTPNRAMRVFYETSHTHNGLRGTRLMNAHFSDVGAWRWEDWAGNHERVKLLVAWVVKTRANVILFDGSDPGKTEEPSQALWEYLDARGLKTLFNVHPGNSAKDTPHDGCTDEDYCTNINEYYQNFPRQMCVARPGFWRVLAARAASAARKHKHRLAGVFCNWDEGPNAIGVEGPEQRLAHCMCPHCGTVTNVELWNRVLDHLNTDPEIAALGLPPIGHGHMGYKNALPDDALLAREVVPHIAPGSLSMIYYYTNNNKAESIEGWLHELEQANARDGGNRRIFAIRELQFACRADMPMVHPSSLRRVDEDYPVFLKYDCFATYACGVYVMHSLGWMLVRYNLHKQWNPQGTWQDWVADTYAHILGTDGAQALSRALDLLLDVQMYHEHNDRDFWTNYDCWGLDPYLAAPDALPVPPGTPIMWDHRPELFAIPGSAFVRLVMPGAQDPHGVMTWENFQPAIAATTALRAQLDEVAAQMDIVQRAAVQTPDIAFWVEQVLQPMHWTLVYLNSRLNLFLSYGSYLQAQEAVRNGADASAAIAEGQTFCRQALDELMTYIRLKPGFASDYPREINPATLHALLEDWAGFAVSPECVTKLDLCAFLDQAEVRAEKGMQTTLPCHLTEQPIL